MNSRRIGQLLYIARTGFSFFKKIPTGGYFFEKRKITNISISMVYYFFLKLMTRTIEQFKDQQAETLSFACQAFGVDRQVYYRAIQRFRQKRDIAGEVVTLVNVVRVTMPKIGSRKLYHLLNDELRVLNKYGRSAGVLRQVHRSFLGGMGRIYT